MTYIIKTVSRQNLWAGNILESMTSEGNSALLLANVDRRPLLQPGLMNFQGQNLQLYNKSLTDWSLGKQLILFPSNLKNKINCLLRDQSFYCLLQARKV